MKTKTIFLTLLFLLCTPVLLLVCGFALPAQYDATFLGELKYKAARLAEESETPRLVLVGGSAAAFGVDSALLQAALPEYKVVNYGMYAALGTTAMLDLTLPDLRAGDLVILMPEQQAQTLSCYFNAEGMWQGLDGAFALLPRINRQHCGRLAGNFPAFAAQKLGYFLSGTAAPGSGVYARAGFNAYGDLDDAACAHNTMPGGVDANTPIVFEPAVFSADFAAYANAYANAAAQKGAAVYYHFSPMNAAAVTPTADMDAYCENLRAALDFALMGSPHTAVMEAGWFYDSNFHLNQSGRTVFTTQLIRDCKAVLGNTTPTEISLPEMPALAAPALHAGADNTDAGCFTWERRGAEIALTGLTEAGQTRQALTLPAELDGLPVTVLESTVFAGDTALQTVTIPASLAAIADGAFAGCTALEKICLLSADPTACTVGQALLKGTAATIYVPQSALNAYKLNYFWSVYAARMAAQKP